MRVPDAVLGFYPALNVQDAFSPSRCLSVMDPLLNAVRTRRGSCCGRGDSPPADRVDPGCAHAWQDILRTVVVAYQGEARATDPLLSPLLAPDWLLRRLPSVYLLGVALDPLLDDTVQFARRLRTLRLAFRLRLVHGLPHGFLNFKDATEETLQAHAHCLAWLHEALHGALPAPAEAAAAAEAPMAETLAAAAAAAVARASDAAAALAGSLAGLLPEALAPAPAPTGPPGAPDDM